MLSKSSLALLLVASCALNVSGRVLFHNAPSFDLHRVASQSALDELFETSAALNDIVWFANNPQLYWVDCTPVNKVQEKIEQDQNQTTLYLSVTQPCEDKNIPLTDFHVSTDAGRRLSVSAKVSGGESAALSKQYELPALAASALISATYSHDHVLRISIPHLSPADLTPSDVPVTIEPAPAPLPPAAAEQPAHQHTEADASAGTQGAAEGGGSAGGEEALRAQMKRLEQELLRLKASLPV
mmetsp:Transcript_27705/g.65801  ORF Transcript_27705/g.65801 Transcript_27705/m.65801 type:complete len:241 (+) Transcript_27705:123-845(+)